MKAAGPVYPWRSHNRFSLLVDGPQFFPRMLEAIAQAEQAIAFEFYLVEAGHCARQMVGALTGAAERGVQVRCLLDGYGTLALGAELRGQLQAAGVEVRYYNPPAMHLRLRNLHRDHRKLLIIDQSAAFVGGAGITDEFWNIADPAAAWHEAMIEMSGPVLQDWRVLFDRTWARSLHPRVWRLPTPRRAARLPALPQWNEGAGRVAYAAAHQHRDVLQSLLRQMYGARQRIYMATPYFLPTGKVRRALIRAARRGVDVQLLLTGCNSDHPPVRYAGQRFYARLLRHGVRIHEYGERFLHMKMVLVDDWVSMGSCNFDHWNLRWNLEANIEILDADTTRAVNDCFQRDFACSHEIGYREWQRRSRWTRLRQHLWGGLDRLVMHFLLNRQ